jgi:hypothetical protein
MKQIKNDYDALVVALTLAVTAPTEKQSKECLQMAIQISFGMPASQVEQAKKEVEVNLERTA